MVEQNGITVAQVMDSTQYLDGVGSANLFSATYAMRIWLNPDKLRGYGLSAAQVLTAVREQNVQIEGTLVPNQP